MCLASRIFLVKLKIKRENTHGTAQIGLTSRWNSNNTYELTTNLLPHVSYWQTYGRLPVCIRLTLWHQNTLLNNIRQIGILCRVWLTYRCRARELLSLNLLLQPGCSHMCGRSPVCVRMWTVSADLCQRQGRSKSRKENKTGIIYRFSDQHQKKKEPVNSKEYPDVALNLTWIKRFLQALNVQAYGLQETTKKKKSWPDY